MWSIYDTMILASGIIVAAIAIVPVGHVPAATRAWSALIGGGLIVAALALGSLKSFRYPSFVFAGPVLALLALGAVVADARRRARPGVPLQFDDQAHGDVLAPVAFDNPMEHLSMTSVAESVLADASVAVPAAETEVEPPSAERETAWREVNNPSTPAARLAELLGNYPEFSDAVAAHPQCYPELRQWIANYAAPSRE
jgi:hypothetical protein